MGSGGARTRSGPPPDPTALRRDRKSDGEWTVLPAEGRQGDPPDWPLVEHEDAVWRGRELELWRALWAKPQAVQWEAMGQELEVALYVRRFVEAEQPGAAVTLSTLAKQQADALGLSIPGMRSHRWKIATDQVAAKRTEKQTESGSAPARRGARDRFRVVDGAAG